MDKSRKLRFEIEGERIRRAKDEARQEDRELLVPKATEALFGKSPEAIRKAIQVGNLTAVFDLWVTDRPVPLVRLSEALSFWGAPDPAKLAQMRENGRSLGEGKITYNLLLPRPMLSLRDPEDLESAD